MFPQLSPTSRAYPGGLKIEMIATVLAIASSILEKIQENNCESPKQYASVHRSLSFFLKVPKSGYAEE